MLAGNVLKAMLSLGRFLISLLHLKKGYAIYANKRLWFIKAPIGTGEKQMNKEYDEVANGCLEKRIRARLYPLQYKATPYKGPKQHDENNECPTHFDQVVEVAGTQS